MELSFLQSSLSPLSSPLEKDAYVLCRVFHKSNIGPPNGHRYAPFIEEEWDDAGSVLIPGEEIADGKIASHDAQSERNSNSVCAAEGSNNGACGEGKDGMQVFVSLNLLRNSFLSEALKFVLNHMNK